MNKLKVCFLLKINEKGLHFDDEVKKVGNNMTSISFSASHRKIPYFSRSVVSKIMLELIQLALPLHMTTYEKNMCKINARDVHK